MIRINKLRKIYPNYVILIKKKNKLYDSFNNKVDEKTLKKYIIIESYNTYSVIRASEK